MSPGEDGLIGIPFPEHSSELLSRLNAQRHSGLLCDLTLTSRGASYQTHRAVMAAVSRYFRRLFGGHEGPRVLQLDCVEPEALASLLEFAYTATLTVRSSGMRELLSAANILGIECVAEACREILGETATNQMESDVGEVEDEINQNKDDDDEEDREVCFGETQTSSQTPLCQSPEEMDERIHRIQKVHTPSSGGFPNTGNTKWMSEYTPINKHKNTLSEGEESYPVGQISQSLEMSGVSGGSGRKRKSQMPQQCPVCQKIIHGAGKLPRHMRTHTGEKPFQCTTCGVRFTRNDKLKIHMRRHTGERPYHCTTCPARFLHSYDLKNHLSLHSGARPFECPLCHKAFAREDHLTRHSKGHGCLELRSRRMQREFESGSGEGLEAGIESEARPGFEENLSQKSRPGARLEHQERSESEDAFETGDQIELGSQLESTLNSGLNLRTSLEAENYHSTKLQPGARAGLQKRLRIKGGAKHEYKTRFEHDHALGTDIGTKIKPELRSSLVFSDELKPADAIRDQIECDVRTGFAPKTRNGAGIKFGAKVGLKVEAETRSRFMIGTGAGLQPADVKFKTRKEPEARLESGVLPRELFETERLPHLGRVSGLPAVLPEAWVEHSKLLWRTSDEPRGKKQDGKPSPVGNGFARVSSWKKGETVKQEEV